jgi:hypothetical protein
MMGMTTILTTASPCRYVAEHIAKAYSNETVRVREIIDGGAT